MTPSERRTALIRLLADIDQQIRKWNPSRRSRSWTLTSGGTLPSSSTFDVRRSNGWRRCSLPSENLPIENQPGEQSGGKLDTIARHDGGFCRTICATKKGRRLAQRRPSDRITDVLRSAISFPDLFSRPDSIPTQRASLRRRSSASFHRKVPLKPATKPMTTIACVGTIHPKTIFLPFEISCLLD